MPSWPRKLQLVTWKMQYKIMARHPNNLTQAFSVCSGWSKLGTEVNERVLSCFQGNEQLGHRGHQGENPGGDAGQACEGTIDHCGLDPSSRWRNELHLHVHVQWQFVFESQLIYCCVIGFMYQ